MLKQVVKLVLAALIAHAAWRVGSEYLTHFRFREAVRLASLAAGPSDGRLRDAILVEAEQRDIPLDGDRLAIARAERRIAVIGSYDKAIEVLPGYRYPWTFNWEVEVFVAPSLVQPPSGR